MLSFEISVFQICYDCSSKFFEHETTVLNIFWKNMGIA